MGEIEHFLMYSPETFLKFAKESLEAQVSDSTIAEVREISATRGLGKTAASFARKMRAQNAVTEWLGPEVESIKFSTGSTDITVTRDGADHYYITRVAGKNIDNIVEITDAIIAEAVFGRKQTTPNKISVIWIAINPAHADEIQSEFLRKRQGFGPIGAEIIIATLEDPLTLRNGFFIQYVLEY
jgi:hypothetical protein